MTINTCGFWALGIDAGGTYTDSVVYDVHAGIVVAKAKALTTRPDPTAGIEASLSQLAGHFDRWGEIRFVSLSTTFATNAIVEGRYEKAGLILMGYPGFVYDRVELEPKVAVGGQIDVEGKLRQPLDVEALVAAGRRFVADGAGAFAVSGMYSVVNSEHEVLAAQVLSDTFGLPVVQGHHLSMALDAGARAVTARLNAGLLPLIAGLIDSVEHVLAGFEIDAPLCLVKGDGTLVSASFGRSRPVELIMSGPAGSMAGGMHLLGVREDAIVADIGGTTTDIAVCLDGQAAIQERGASVGDFQTHVVAIDIRTVGLGGDSYVQLGQKGELTIGPGRVVPLGYLGDVYGSVVERLAELLDRPADSVLYSQADFFLLLKNAADGQVSQEEMRIVEALRDGPLDRQTISQRVGCTHPSLFVTRELEARGFVIRCSLTPTDALIAEGKLALWSRRASQLAIGLLARQAGVQTAELAERVMEEVYLLLGREIALQACTVDGLDIDNAFLDNMLRKNTKNRVVVPQLKISMPVVLVGAPAVSYCEGVRRVLGTLVETVEHGEVANAVGSVVGSVVVRLIGEITIDLSGRYWVHIIDERFEFEGLAEAKGFAQGRLETLAADGLTDAGGTDGTVTVEMEDHYGLIAGTIAAERVYLRTELHARAVGKPAIS